MQIDILSRCSGWKTTVSFHSRPKFYAWNVYRHSKHQQHIPLRRKQLYRRISHTTLFGPIQRPGRNGGADGGGTTGGHSCQLRTWSSGNLFIVVCIAKIYTYWATPFPTITTGMTSGTYVKSLSAFKRVPKTAPWANWNKTFIYINTPGRGA